MCSISNISYINNNTSYKLFAFRFIFSGIVSYGTGHYVAMIKRINGSWEIHNDLQKKITKLNRGDTKVNPHLVIYIKK